MLTLSHPQWNVPKQQGIILSPLMRQVLKDALDKLRNIVPRKLKDSQICLIFPIDATWVVCCSLEELRDSVEADLKQCASYPVLNSFIFVFDVIGKTTSLNIPMQSYAFSMHRLESAPASGVGVDANDFFLSFKLACEAVGMVLSLKSVCAFLLSCIRALV